MTKKKQHLEFTLRPSIYPVDIHVVYSNDPDKVAKYFRKMTKEPNLDRSLPDITVVPHASTGSIGHHILLEFAIDDGRDPEELASLVAHEAVHASYRLERIVGDCFNMDIQEPQCYFVQYLVLNILAKIWKFKKKRKTS